MLHTLDTAILLFIQQTLRTPFLSGLMTAYTNLGNKGLLWIGICLVLLFFRKTRRAGLLALLAMLLGLLLNNLLLKELVARPRPWLNISQLLPLMEPPDPNSFPSGHTCAAFAAAGAWGYTLRQRWAKLLAFLAAGLMGFSRLYVGVHYPSDVLAGALMGLLCAWMVCTFWQKKIGTLQ